MLTAWLVSSAPLRPYRGLAALRGLSPPLVLGPLLYLGTDHTSHWLCPAVYFEFFLALYHGYNGPGLVSPTGTGEVLGYLPTSFLWPGCCMPGWAGTQQWQEQWDLQRCAVLNDLVNARSWGFHGLGSGWLWSGSNRVYALYSCVYWVICCWGRVLHLGQHCFLWLRLGFHFFWYTGSLFIPGHSCYLVFRVGFGFAFEWYSHLLSKNAPVHVGLHFLLCQDAPLSSIGPR